MANKQLLINYYDNLCNVLNQNGFYIEGRFGEELYKFKYRTDYENPELTMLGITENLDAYLFLYNKGLLRKDICYECGESPISGKYIFTEPINKISLNICKSCYQKRPVKNINNTGCLLFFSIPLVLLFIYLFF